MLYIPCPYCGHRDETEFTYGGPSHITRPELTASDREWTHYLYHRQNSKGPYRERWLHNFGCGQWFNVLRDTATHEILAVYLMGQAGPQAQLGSTEHADRAGHSASPGRPNQSDSPTDTGRTDEAAQ